MTLIEGVGDEVTHFFVVMLVVIIGIVAWWSTSISEQPLIQTVLILEPHRNRSIGTVAAAAMTAAAAAQDTGQTEPIVITESDLEQAAASSATPDGAANGNKSPTASTGVQTQEASEPKAGSSSGSGSRDGRGPIEGADATAGPSTGSSHDRSGDLGSSDANAASVVATSGGNTSSTSTTTTSSNSEDTWIHNGAQLRRRLVAGSSPTEELRSHHIATLVNRIRVGVELYDAIHTNEITDRVTESSQRPYNGEERERPDGDALNTNSEVDRALMENGESYEAHIASSDSSPREEAGRSEMSSHTGNQCTCTTTSEQCKCSCSKSVLTKEPCKCDSSNSACICEKKKEDMHLRKEMEEQVEKMDENRCRDTPSGVEQRVSSVQNSQSADDIRIRLKYLNDNQKLVQGKLQEPLGDFKRRHFAVELEGNKVVRLIFNGQVLHSDRRTLQNYGLFDNCVVHCLVHPQRSASPSAHSGRTNNAIEESSNPNPVVRDWDLSHLLYMIIAGLLFLGWYIRFTYPQLFSGTTTVTLCGLSGFFAISVIGMFLPDQDGIRT